MNNSRHNSIRNTLIVLLLLLTVSCSTAFAAKGEAEFPSDLTIVAPEDNVPAALVPLIGKWSGKTNYGMDVKMAIEKIYFSGIGLMKIQVVYAWDNQYMEAGWSRQTASYDPANNVILFKVANQSFAGAFHEFKIPKDNSNEIAGNWKFGRYNGTATMRREK